MVLSPALWVPTQDRAAQQDFQALNSGSPGHPTPSQGSAPACSPTQCSRGPNAAGAVWFPPLCCASVSPPPTALEKLPVCPRSALGLGWKHPVGFLHPQQPDKHTRVALGLLQGSRGSIQGAFPSKPSPALRPCRSHTCAAAALRSMRVGLLAHSVPPAHLCTPHYTREEDGWKSIQDLLAKGTVRGKQALTVPPSLPRDTRCCFGTGPGWRDTVLRRSHTAGCAPSRSAQPWAVGLRLQLAELSSFGHSHQHSLSGHSPIVRDPFPCCCPACTAWQQNLTLSLTLTQPQSPREHRGTAGWGAQEPGCGMLADLRGCLRTTREALCRISVLPYTLWSRKTKQQEQSSRRTCWGTLSTRSWGPHCHSAIPRAASSGTAASPHHPGVVTEGSPLHPFHHAGSHGVRAPIHIRCPMAQHRAASFRLASPIPSPVLQERPGGLRQSIVVLATSITFGSPWWRPWLCPSPHWSKWVQPEPRSHACPGASLSCPMALGPVPALAFLGSLEGSVAGRDPILPSAH